MRTSSESREIRYDLARDRARGLLTLTRQKPPVDVQAIIDLAGVPVVERVLVDGVRGTIGDVAGRRTIILNRRHRFSSQQERRWALAEELGHVLLDHRLVESTQPGKPTMGLLEERRLLYEREARAFAAELLMPFFEVRKRWFAISQERPVKGELSLEDRVKRLADEFGVTPMAMRVQFEQMKRVQSVAKETWS
ncbi:MAG TPA: ImmA/IrrE family metallo-endopeptidase [bacterium]|nr:ImmA/IrrE family metallo-endopeptidase [bacterium]